MDTLLGISILIFMMGIPLFLIIYYLFKIFNIIDDNKKSR